MSGYRFTISGLLTVPLILSLSKGEPPDYGILNVGWYYHQRRGGFVTRPAPTTKPAHRTSTAIVDRFPHSGQGGLQTRPYHSRQPHHKPVVPAKAGIQEIPRKRTCRLLRVLDSGFRRNDGVITGMTGCRMTGLWCDCLDGRMVRPAHHERMLLMSGFWQRLSPLILSLSKDALPD